MSDFKFKKKYGQNFLVDKNIVSKIVADIVPGDKSLVIEIGCGDGKLTKVLCEKFDYVLGYEIDNLVRDRLFDNLSSFDNFSIIFDDFLKRDIVSDLAKYEYSSLYIIANLPYYITTPIIEKIVLLYLNPSLVRIMVQKEVGDRLVSLPGSRDYGSFSVFVNYNFSVCRNFVVNRKCFYPVPNVDSMIVSFYGKEKTYVKNLEHFYKLVRDSFRFKRKTIRNNLKEYDLDVVSSVLNRYGYTLDVRAEMLDTDIFCEISNELCI